ncbi:MAG: alpha-glucosidase [Clostridiales Family XIII bacterium]|jgi:oligo-1,6-glucosidase|nr:alpha-glucosidase [Clostridiales Family XIII bacterium]
MDERKWWKESVVYQIYPQSFCDGNGDGVGDLPGIIGKLDYLADLGADVLWLSPIYPSPGHDNGYDISDYEAIDPRYGDMEDFERLLAETHARGLRLIIDLVVNHTSIEHPWFKSARSGKNDPKRDYYIWRDPAPGGRPPNNWGALFGGSAWTLDEKSGQYYLHLFSPWQPELNWENPLLRQDIYAMMRRWLAKGVDGFRMDVISLIAKPDDFSDGPVGASGYFDPRERVAANPKVHEYLREMRKEALSGHDVMTVGEASATTLEDARQLTNPSGDELDMVFQFEHMDLDGGETFKWNDRTIPLLRLKNVMAKWQQGLAHSGWNALFWNNHDQPRMLSRLGDEGEYREASAKMLAACLHMMQGSPFIYQGEELGMTNMRFTRPEQLRDGESRNAYRHYVLDGDIAKDDMLRYISLKSRDNARTPIQWDASPGAGFTQAAPWMDINPNHTEINAEEQLHRKGSVLSFYKELTRLRHMHPIVVYGDFVPYAQEDSRVFAYTRILDGEILFVCCNFTAQALDFAPPDGLQGENARLLLTNCADSAYMAESRLAPYEAVVILANGHSGSSSNKPGLPGGRDSFDGVRTPGKEKS